MHAVYNYSDFVDLLPRPATQPSPSRATCQVSPDQHVQQQCADPLVQTEIAGKQVPDDV